MVVTVSPVAEENLFKFSCASVKMGLRNSFSLDFQVEFAPANLIVFDCFDFDVLDCILLAED